jgi:hypothetical protein
MIRPYDLSSRLGNRAQATLTGDPTFSGNSIKYELLLPRTATTPTKLSH